MTPRAPRPRWSVSPSRSAPRPPWSWRRGSTPPGRRGARPWPRGPSSPAWPGRWGIARPSARPSRRSSAWRPTRCRTTPRWRRPRAGCWSWSRRIARPCSGWPRSLAAAVGAAGCCRSWISRSRTWRRSPSGRWRPPSGSPAPSPCAWPWATRPRRPPAVSGRWSSTPKTARRGCGGPRPPRRSRPSPRRLTSCRSSRGGWAGGRAQRTPWRREPRRFPTASSGRASSWGGCTGRWGSWPSGGSWIRCEPGGPTAPRRACSGGAPGRRCCTTGRAARPPRGAGARWPRSTSACASCARVRWTRCSSPRPTSTWGGWMTPCGCCATLRRSAPRTWPSIRTARPSPRRCGPGCGSCSAPPGASGSWPAPWRRTPAGPAIPRGAGRCCWRRRSTSRAAPGRGPGRSGVCSGCCRRTH